MEPSWVPLRRPVKVYFLGLMFWLLRGFKTPFLRIKSAELIISWVLLGEVMTLAFFTKYF